MSNKKQEYVKELVDRIKEAKIVVSDYGECLERTPQVYESIHLDFLALYLALYNDEKREELKVIMNNKNSRLYNRTIPFKWDEILLPYDKKLIETALNGLIKISKNDEEIEKYKVGLLLLENFIDFRELDDEK